MSKMRDYIFLFLIVDSDVYVRLLKSDYKIALIISFHQWFYRFPIWIQYEDQNIIGSSPLCVSAVIETMS